MQTKKERKPSPGMEKHRGGGTEKHGGVRGEHEAAWGADRVQREGRDGHRAVRSAQRAFLLTPGSSDRFVPLAGGQRGGRD